MRIPKISYGQLDAVLQALGFSVRVDIGKRRLYTHEATGALMSLPGRKPSETAHATYVAAVRKVLTDYGIVAEDDFALQLQGAT